MSGAIDIILERCLLIERQSQFGLTKSPDKKAVQVPAPRHGFLPISSVRPSALYVSVPLLLRFVTLHPCAICAIHGGAAEPPCVFGLNYHSSPLTRGKWFLASKMRCISGTFIKCRHLKSINLMRSCVQRFSPNQMPRWAPSIFKSVGGAVTRRRVRRL